MQAKLTGFDVTTDPGDQWTPAHLTVWPLCTAEDGTPLDRPRGSGMAVKDRRMADRLMAAVRDGAAMTIGEVRTDTSGRTYPHTSWRVLGRILNAELRRLGY